MADQNAARAFAHGETGDEQVVVAQPVVERGTPSQALQESGLITPGEEAGTPEYESITDAASEQGVFHIVGGYLDDDGVIHSEVHLRSMSGEEEDLLGNRAIPILDRLNTILKQCTLRLGTITERGKLSVAIDRLPIGAREHMIVCLRRTTHWKKTKDVFDMDVRCPFERCEKEGSYAVDLTSLETFEMPNPDKREHKVKLSDSKTTVVWRIASLAQEKMLDLVTDMDDKAALTYAIIVRIVSVDEKDMRVGMQDMLTPDHKKLKLSKKASELYTWVRKLSVNDREELRQSFLNEEPGINTTVDVTCEHCRKDFKTKLGIAQETFWFPSSASKRLKTKSST